MEELSDVPEEKGKNKLILIQSRVIAPKFLKYLYQLLMKFTMTHKGTSVNSYLKIMIVSFVIVVSKIVIFNLN